MSSDYPLVQTETSSIVMCDPPSGWRYGFPKQFTRDNNNQTKEAWFLANGYPQWLIDQGSLNHCRYWSIPNRAVITDFPPAQEDDTP